MLKVVHAKKLEVMHTRSVFLAHVAVYIRTCNEMTMFCPQVCPMVVRLLSLPIPKVGSSHVFIHSCGVRAR